MLALCTKTPRKTRSRGETQRREENREESKIPLCIKSIIYAISMVDESESSDSPDPGLKFPSVSESLSSISFRTGSTGRAGLAGALTLLRTLFAGGATGVGAGGAFNVVDELALDVVPPTNAAISRAICAANLRARVVLGIVARGASGIDERICLCTTGASDSLSESSLSKT
jgi:hypothetical protein